MLIFSKAVGRTNTGRAMYPNSFQGEYYAEYPLEDADYDEAAFQS